MSVRKTQGCGSFVRVAGMDGSVYSVMDETSRRLTYAAVELGRCADTWTPVTPSSIGLVYIDTDIDIDIEISPQQDLF